MNRHKAIVADISRRVSQFYKSRVPFRISHGSTNSTRHNVHNRTNTIDTSALCNILDIDVSKKTALVEPNVPMDRLVAATLKHGLVPPVVMEFPGITAGGGYAGTAGESSSFKHGFFDRTVNYVEIVLGDGKVVTASDQEKEDLFRGAAGAVGSLGVTTLLEIRLTEAKPYVSTTYYPVKSIEEALLRTQELTKQSDVDYVDGMMFSGTLGVVVCGRMVDHVPGSGAIRSFSRPWDPWFYIHARELVSDPEHTSPVIEIIPLAEYLFRYDRGGFWVGASAFKYWRFPFNRFTRWFLDDFLHTRMLYRALHASRQSMSYVVQDLALPYQTAAQFVNYTNTKFGIYPLWLCPLRQHSFPTFHPHSKEMEADNETPKSMINIGLWGFGPKDRNKFVSLNRDLEQELRRLGGMKWLYAQTYYTEKEFWDIYDRKWYEGLRSKYAAEYLPTVFDKVKVDAEKEQYEIKKSWSLWILGIWPFGGIWGIWKAMWSGEWKIPKQIKLAEVRPIGSVNQPALEYQGIATKGRGGGGGDLD